MSGVLERMVQRSRGQLPAIEPLVRAQQTAAGAVPLVVEESAAPALRARNAAVSGRERASRDESAGLVQDKVKRGAPQASVPAPKDSRRSEALEVSRVKQAAANEETLASKDTDRDGLNRVRLERAVELPEAGQETKEQRQSSIEMRVEKVSAKLEEAAGESVPTKAKAAKRAESQVTPAPRNEADAAPSANDELQQTEIHITIGSVELRSQRVAPVAPKTPPFRPRVTLDEFLKRGAGSGGRGARS
jgi:hypothetical protein